MKKTMLAVAVSFALAAPYAVANDEPIIPIDVEEVVIDETGDEGAEATPETGDDQAPETGGDLEEGAGEEGAGEEGAGEEGAGEEGAGEEGAGDDEEGTWQPVFPGDDGDEDDTSGDNDDSGNPPVEQPEEEPADEPNLYSHMDASKALEETIFEEEEVLVWGGGASVNGNLEGLMMVQVVGPALMNADQITAAGGVVLKAGSNLIINTKQATFSALQGGLSAEAGSTLTLNVGSDTDPQLALVRVVGDLSQAAGSNVLVKASIADFLADGAFDGGEEFTLFDVTGEIDDSGAIYATNSPLLKLTLSEVVDGKVRATIEASSADSIKASLSAAGANATSAAAASQFADLAISNFGEHSANPLVQQILQGDATQLARIGKELSPEPVRVDHEAARQSLSLGARSMTNRVKAVRSGASSGDQALQHGLWIEGLYSKSDLSGRDGDNGFDGKAKGFIIGADTKLNEQVTVGLSYSRIDNDMDIDGGSSLDIESDMLSVYGGWESADGLYVDGSFTYGVSDNESRRNLIDGNANADFDSKMYGVDLMVGKAFAIDENLVFEPRFAARYTKLKTDSYSENGTSLGRLSVGSNSADSGELGLGFKLSKQYDFAGGVLTPSAGWMGYRDYLGDDSSMRSSFVLGGDTFSAASNVHSKSSYEVSAGLNYRRDNMVLGVNYDRLMKKDFKANSLSAELRYEF